MIILLKLWKYHVVPLLNVLNGIPIVIINIATDEDLK